MKATSVICLLATVLAVSLQGVSGAKKALKPVITVDDLGAVEGAYANTAWTKRKYMKFLDIPYASTSSEKRFQPPGPVEAFDETYNAYASDSACPSTKNIDDIMTYGEMFDFEDCLHLTVATPNRSGNFPVMVYLAGYDLDDTENEDAEADYLLEKDIVLVTVQYRGGVLGFLSTLSDDIPGNAGVLDVIAALRYINKHIKYFGGDNKRVTLFGQYGNAALINTLLMTPLLAKENLFQQVIYQSGSALMSSFATANPIEYAKKIGTSLGCDNVEDIDLLNKCFKGAELAALLYAAKDTKKEYGAMPFFTVGGKSGLLPEYPRKLAETGKLRSVPMMGGVVKHVAMGTGKVDDEEALYDKFISELEKSLSQNITNENHKTFIRKYFPSKLFSKIMQRAIWPGVIDLHGLDIKEAVSKALTYNCEKEKSFLYAFNYIGTYNRLEESEDDGFEDVTLTDDSIYLFPFRKYSNTLEKDDKTMAKIMVDLWTSFAIDGEPSSPLIIAKWPPMMKGQVGPYMKLDLVPEVGFYYPDEFFTTVLDTRQGFVLE